MSSELAIWTNSQTTTLEKRKTAQESSRKTKGSILRSLQVFLTVPPSKSRVFDKKKTVLTALNFFPMKGGLRIEKKSKLGEIAARTLHSR